MVKKSAEVEGGKKPKLRNGLIKPEGYEFYQYHFRFRGKVYKGTTKCAAYADAVAYKQALISRLNDESLIIEKKSVPTLREVYQEWAALRKIEVSESHFSNMSIAVLTHAKMYCETPITEIDNKAAMTIRSDYLKTRGGFEGYRSGFIELGHTEGGANQMIKDLYALCGWAVEVGIITQRPFRLKKLDVTPPEHNIVWPEQVKFFLAEIDKGQRLRIGTQKDGKPILEICPHSATAARLMIYLGLRENETRFAEWEHIDWRLGQFTVGRGIVVEHEPKDREKRKIPIPQTLLQHLRLRWEEAGMPTSGLILPDRGKGNRLTSPNTPHYSQFTKKNIARAGALLKIAGLTPHDLRRTFATSHYEIGTPIGQIAMLMGHASPETTLKHYIVTRQKDQVEAQDRLDALFG